MILCKIRLLNSDLSVFRVLKFFKISSHVMVSKLWENFSSNIKPFHHFWHSKGFQSCFLSEFDWPVHKLTAGHRRTLKNWQLILVQSQQQSSPQRGERARRCDCAWECCPYEVCVCVCVCERERERERKGMYLLNFSTSKAIVSYWTHLNDDLDLKEKWTT